MQGCVSRKPRSNEAIQEHQGKTQNPVDQQYLLIIILRSRTQLALHLTLVATVVRDIEEKPTNQHGQESKVMTVTQTVMTK